MVLGDFNAVLRVEERATSSPSVSTHPYCQFLSSTGALDLWLLKGHVNVWSDYTHKNYHSGVTSIIDQATIHMNQVFLTMIQSLPNFIGSTDHCFIKVTMVLNRLQHPVTPAEVHSPPARLRYPMTSEKHHFTEFAFANRVDSILSTCLSIYHEAEDLQSFCLHYESIT